MTYNEVLDAHGVKCHWVADETGHLIDRKSVINFSNLNGPVTVVDGGVELGGASVLWTDGSSNFDLATFAWAAEVEMPNPASGTEQTIFDNSGPYPAHHSGLAIKNDGHALLWFQATSGNYPWLVGNSVLSADENHRVTGSFDGTTMRLMVDGVLDGELVVPTGDRTPKVPAARPLGLGRAWDNTRYFHGIIRNPQFFPHGLTEADDLAIYEAGQQEEAVQLTQKQHLEAALGITLETGDKVSFSLNPSTVKTVNADGTIS